MDNHHIAGLLDELADLLEFQGENPFRIRAYRSGARAIGDLEQSVASLVENSDYQLADLPGIGNTLAEKIQVLVSTGKMPQLEKLREQIPLGVLQMVRIPGLGAKKAAQLHRELGIHTLQELRDACEAGRVRALKGFAAKTEQAILEGLAIAETAAQRTRWADAEPIVLALLNYMQQSDAIERIEPVGSYRRGCETIGNLDLLVVASDRDAVMDHLQAYPQRSETLLRENEKKTKMSIRIGQTFQVDMRMVETKQFGVALQYFTGSKAHNIRLRMHAQQQGLTFDEQGVFSGSERSTVTTRTEADVYTALQLPLIPPELREDRNELDWEASDAHSDLVTVDQIVGDLHMHTSATDGEGTIRDMADAAVKRRLQYIAITDHSQRVAMARGLDPTRLRDQWSLIDTIRPEYDGRLVILKGIECDILEKGGMDLPEDVLAEADWVLASVHYGQKQPREQITERILGAVEHRYVDAIAHPTGRLINRRPAYDVDLDIVMRAARKTGTIMELNANPARLDLNDVHCCMAKRQKIPIVINTDAHSPRGMEVMRFGIIQARRGRLTAQDVANTWSWDRLRETLKRNRQG